MLQQQTLSRKDAPPLVLYHGIPEGGGTKRGVVLVHGYGDHVGRHAFLIERLLADGRPVLALDLRGHGNSGGQRGHVRDFKDYQDDLRALWEHPWREALGRPILHGHSMGGLVATRFAGAPATDPKPHALSLSSPFFAFAYAPPRLKVLAASLIGRVFPRLAIRTGTDLGALSTDQSVAEDNRRDPLTHGQTTPAWFRSLRREQARIHEYAARLTLPVHALHGTADRIADWQVTRDVIAGIRGDRGRFTPREGLFHEVFSEPPPSRDRAYACLQTWLDGLPA